MRFEEFNSRFFRSIRREPASLRLKPELEVPRRRLRLRGLFSTLFHESRRDVLLVIRVRFFS